MDQAQAKLLKDFELGKISRRRLLRALGITALGAPFAADLRNSAFAQGGCRDGYGQGRCMLSMEKATAPIEPIFQSTGWKTVALENIMFEVADYKKEAAFYTALMGWKLRSDDGKQAIMDIGTWGSAIFKQVAMPAAPPTPPPPAAPAGGDAAGGRGGRGGRGGGAGQPARA